MTPSAFDAFQIVASVTPVSLGSRSRWTTVRLVLIASASPAFVIFLRTIAFAIFKLDQALALLAGR